MVVSYNSREFCLVGLRNYRRPARGFVCFGRRGGRIERPGVVRKRRRDFSRRSEAVGLRVEVKAGAVTRVTVGQIVLIGREVSPM